MSGVINRYSRHELLKGWGEESQSKVRQASVLIIGAGGLGSPASLYLAGAGVGKITIVDGDVVDLTNLQRQVIHSTERVGVPKALSAKISLQAVNPDVQVVGLMTIPNEELLNALVESHDVVLDCTDNTKSRYLLNSVCANKKTPLVTAGAVAYTGQVTVLDFRKEDSACYECIFPNHDGADEKASTFGVFAPLVGMLGCMQAAEALKMITGIGKPLTGRMLMIDALTMEFHEIKYKKNPKCSTCNH